MWVAGRLKQIGGDGLTWEKEVAAEVGLSESWSRLRCFKFPLAIPCELARMGKSNPIQTKLEIAIGLDETVSI